ncbi:MAG: hypothetical protein JSW67_06125, partial [Candidatus Latescibacterota bacterium]
MNRLRLDHRLDHRLYVIAVFASGMGLLSLLSSELARSGWQLPEPAVLALWLVMMSVAVVAPVPLPAR